MTIYPTIEEQIRQKRLEINELLAEQNQELKKQIYRLKHPQENNRRD